MMQCKMMHVVVIGVSRSEELLKIKGPCVLLLCDYRFDFWQNEEREKEKHRRKNQRSKAQFSAEYLKNHTF